MADTTLKTRIILRHDNTAGWAAVEATAVLLAGELGVELLGNGKAKLKVVHISSKEIGNIFVPLPSLQEQDAIAVVLDQKISNITELVEIKKSKIEKLKKLKESLIYEYVTGKKRVSL